MPKQALRRERLTVFNRNSTDFTAFIARIDVLLQPAIVFRPLTLECL
jgi:hypothetical protein